MHSKQGYKGRFWLVTRATTQSLLPNIATALMHSDDKLVNACFLGGGGDCTMQPEVLKLQKTELLTILTFGL